MGDARSSFFNNLMCILDNAEGERDTTYGPFSFLWDNSYVKKAVVSSFETNTSITGLKMFLARNVLKLYPEKEKRNNAVDNTGGDITLGQLSAVINGTATDHKYRMDYTILDDCIDVEKNKRAMLEKIHAPIDEAGMLRYIEESNILFPYVFMDRLREEVWFWLREFSMLCDQKICSECSKKSMVYFRFIQAVALYEIFYIELVQERAAEYMEQWGEVADKLIKNLETINGFADGLEETERELQMERLIAVEKLFGEIRDMFTENPEKESPNDYTYKAGVFQLLVIEFAISLHAMCDLLMIFEAMHVCEPKMRGIQHLSLEIHNRLDEIFDKELATLEKSNVKRYKRYREVNLKLEEMQKNQFPEHEDLDIAATIYTFMEELCKPIGQWDRGVFRGLEVLLAYPVYRGKDTFGKRE